MNIQTRTTQNVTVIDLSGRLTAGAPVQALHDTVRELLRQGKSNLLVNMQGLTLMDSSGLGELVACQSSAQAGGAALKLLHVEANVRQVMDMANRTSSFDIFSRESAAVASF